VQLRDMSKVATAIASGDLTQKSRSMCEARFFRSKRYQHDGDQLRSFAAEVTRVARESAPKVSLAARPPCPESLARGKI